VRTERWRYTRWSDGTAELYDEADDREETRNLAGSPASAGTVQNLRQLLDQVGPLPQPVLPPAAKPKQGK